jgi:hypothetical protein
MVGMSVDQPLTLDNVVRSSYTDSLPTPIRLKPGNVGLDQNITPGSVDNRAYIATRNFGLEDPDSFARSNIDPNLPAAVVNDPRYIAVDPVPDLELENPTYQTFGSSRGLDLSTTPEIAADEYRQRAKFYRNAAAAEALSPTGTRDRAEQFMNLADAFDGEAPRIDAAMRQVNANTVPSPTETVYRRTVGPRGGSQQVDRLGELPFEQVAREVAGPARQGPVVEEVLELPRVPAAQGLREVMAANPKTGELVKAIEMGTPYDVTIVSDLDNPLGGGNRLSKAIVDRAPGAKANSLRQGVRYREFPTGEVELLDPGMPVLDPQGKTMIWRGQPIKTVPVDVTGELDNVPQVQTAARLRNANRAQVREDTMAELGAARDEGYLIDAMGDPANIPMTEAEVLEIQNRGRTPQQTIDTVASNYVPPQPMTEDQRTAIARMSDRLTNRNILDAGRQGKLRTVNRYGATTMGEYPGTYSSYT